MTVGGVLSKNSIMLCYTDAVWKLSTSNMHGTYGIDNLQSRSYLSNVHDSDLIQQ